MTIYAFVASNLATGAFAIVITADWVAIFSRNLGEFLPMSGGTNGDNLFLGSPIPRPGSRGIVWGSLVLG